MTNLVEHLGRDTVLQWLEMITGSHVSEWTREDYARAVGACGAKIRMMADALDLERRRNAAQADTEKIERGEG